MGPLLCKLVLSFFEIVILPMALQNVILSRLLVEFWIFLKFRGCSRGSLASRKTCASFCRFPASSSYDFLSHLFLVNLRRSLLRLVERKRQICSYRLPTDGVDRLLVPSHNARVFLQHLLQLLLKLAR